MGLESELERLVSDSPDGVATYEGERGNYMILNEAAIKLRKQVQEGIAEADTGLTDDWDVNAILRQARAAKAKHAAD
jgi:hypothetical protein